MILKKILTYLVVTSIFVSTNFSGSLAYSSPLENVIATESLFSLLLNSQKKDIAMLDYIFGSAILSGKLDPMTEDTLRDNLFYGIDLSSEKVSARFHFEKSEDSGTSGIRIVPCSFYDKGSVTDYWCVVKREKENQLYFQFFTEKERNDQRFREKLSLLRYFERAEQSVINIAKNSEKYQDEKIRNAFYNKDREIIPITLRDHTSIVLSLFYFLAHIGCERMIKDLGKILREEQLVVVAGTTEDTRIDMPHAGGRGIYLPDKKEFIDPAVIAHELFAKAGLKHEENQRIQALFEKFAENGMSLPRITGEERKLIEEIKEASFLQDMNSVIDTRDYSSENRLVRFFSEKIFSKVLNFADKLSKKNAEAAIDRFGEQIVKNGIVSFPELEDKARKIFGESSQRYYTESIRLLEHLGITLEADRVILCLFEKGGLKAQRMAMWSETSALNDEKIFTEKDFFKDLPWSMRNIKNGQTIKINTPGQFPSKAQKDKAFFEKHGTKSLMMVPVKGSSGEIEGFIFVDRVYSRKNWTKDNVRIPENIAGMISDSIRQIKIRKELEKKKKEAETLLYISTLINAVKDIGELLDQLLEFLCLRDDLDCGGVYLFDDQGGLKMEASLGLSPRFTEAAGYFTAESAQAKLVKMGKTVSVSYPDLLHADIISGNMDIRKKEGLKALTIIPLVQDGEVFGSINLASRSRDELDAGLLSMLVGITRQMSEGLSKRITENKLKEEQELLKLAVDAADEGIWQLDMGTSKFTYRENVAKLLGYTLEELVPDIEAWLSIVHNDDRAELEDLLRECKEGRKEVFVHEYRMLTRTGEWKWFRTKGKVHMDPANGQLPSLTGVIIDVDARHRAEDVTREREKYYRKVLNESPIGIAVVDAEGSISFNNPAFSEMLIGERTLDLSDNNVFSFLGITGSKEGWMLNGESISFETVLSQKMISKLLGMRSAYGKEVYIECKITPMSFKNGAYYEYLIHLQDITSIKKYEKELEEAYQKMKDQTAEFIKTRFSLATNEIAAEWAHEINNPTANIMVLADRLFEKMKAKEEISAGEYARVLTLVRRESERISSITSRILGFARATSLGKVPCSIEQILTDIMILKKKKMEDFGIDLDLKFGDKPSIVIANKSRLQQAFDNVIKNAISFMDNSEVRKLTISTELVKDNNGFDMVKIAFSDTGAGIKPENIEGIWETFRTERVDNRGIGIGLAEVRAVAEEHGGLATAESVYGKGATFIIKLPIKLIEDTFSEKFIGEAEGIMFQKLWHDYNNMISGLYYLWDMKRYTSSAGIPQYALEAYKRIHSAGKRIEVLVKEAQQISNILAAKQRQIKVIAETKTDILSDFLTFEPGRMPEGDLMEKGILLERYMDTFQKMILEQAAPEEQGITIQAYRKERSRSEILKTGAEAELLTEFFSSFLSAGINPENTEKFERVKRKVTEADISIARIISEVDSILEKEFRARRSAEIFDVLLGIKPVAELLLSDKEMHSERDNKSLRMVYDSILRGMNQTKKVYVEKEIKEALDIFKTNEHLFPERGVIAGDVQVFSGFEEELIMPGERIKFISVVYELLKVGSSEEDFLIFTRENEDKEISVRIETDRQSGEIVITLINNYFRFKEKALIKTKDPNGRELQKVLSRRQGKDNILANINNMLETFAGRITLENVKKGSIMRVFVPCLETVEIRDGKIVINEDVREEDLHNEKFTRYPAKSFEDRPNIIIAEDEVSQRMGMKEFLEKEELNVYSARNIKEAYELVVEMEANNIDIDLGIFDVNMPTDLGRQMKSGLDLSESLRELKYTFPIIITTGQAVSSSAKFEFREDLREKGVFQACLSKPVDNEELKGIMRDLIGEKMDIGTFKKGMSVRLADISKKVILVYGREQKDFERILFRTGLSKQENTVIYVRDKEGLKREIEKGGIDLIIDTTGGEVDSILKEIFDNLKEAPPVFDFVNQESDQIRLMNTLASIGA